MIRGSNFGDPGVIAQVMAAERAITARGSVIKSLRGRRRKRRTRLRLLPPGVDKEFSQMTCGLKLDRRYPYPKREEDFSVLNEHDRRIVLQVKKLIKSDYTALCKVQGLLSGLIVNAQTIQIDLANWAWSHPSGHYLIVGRPPVKLISPILDDIMRVRSTFLANACMLAMKSLLREVKITHLLKSVLEPATAP